MMGLIQYCLLVLLIDIFVPGSARQQYCNWSNEGCSSDSDCCSANCVRKHQGTNYRCERCTVHEPCYVDYHCEEGLECGRTYMCCAPYWGTCVDTNDCCEKEHVCRRVPEFTYKKCLFPSGCTDYFKSRNYYVFLGFFFTVQRIIST